MKAAHLVAKDKIEVSQCPKPRELKPHEMLIKVHAAALNPIDVKMNIFTVSSAMIPSSRKKGEIGLDYAGGVEQVGDDVTNFKVGDEVMGMSSALEAATFCEYIIAQGGTEVKTGWCGKKYKVENTNDLKGIGKSVFKKPKNLSWEEAAGFGVVSYSAYDALNATASKGPDRGSHLQKGQRLLILGSSGGCGSIGVQLAENVFDAHVTGVCSSANVELCKELGCDEVVDYTKNDMKTWQPEEKFDLVYDTVSSEDPRDPDYQSMDIIQRWLKPWTNWEDAKNKDL